MNKSINFRRGLDLKLKGEVPAESAAIVKTAPRIAMVPDDFPGFTPKLAVKEGDVVAEGAPLLFDKLTPDIIVASPVAGTVRSIVRGDRRKILRVVVDATKTDTPAANIPTGKKSPEEIRLALMKSGLWVMMRQRPYDIVPAPAAVPANIFVTAFDSAPLAPSLADAVKGKDAEIKAGVKALAALTAGKVYVSSRDDAAINLPDEAEHIIINGPHPSGNVGIQAAAIAPVNKGETIWTLDIVTLARIGSLMLNGHVDWSTTVAVTGSEIEAPYLVNTCIGAEIASILDLKESGHHRRIISGNVLTGNTVPADGFLRLPYRQITVIPEGDDVNEFMGWASISPNKMSSNRSFPSRLMPWRKFTPDARLLGGRRAMIMSGEYDKVLPMDILPEYLIKAILSRDIDRMEALGIYEIAPEDFALCEYVDPSKLELQKIVREGLDYLRKELD